MTGQVFEIVVAHYNEDLSWLKTTVNDCIVYSKGAFPPLDIGFKCLTLPNIGREGHTYLHHIISRYHELADITLFVQGRIDDHVSWSAEEIKDACMKYDDHEILTFPSTDAVSTELVRFDEWGGIQWEFHPCLNKWTMMDMKRAEVSPATYFARLFGHGRVPSCIGYVSGAVFAVPRKLIYNHTLSFYQDLQEAMFLAKMEHINPETGYYMERFWLAMWKPDEYICWDSADVSATERNSRGQLAKGRWRPLPWFSSQVQAAMITTSPERLGVTKTSQFQ